MNNSNKNCIHIEIRDMLQSEKHCCLSDHSHLSKKLNVRIFKIIVLPVVLYGCEI